MVSQTGAQRNALVLDFGLGGLARAVEDWSLPRLTATREILGTPAYAAPEQLRGEPVSTRSDLYAWGLILLECLTGELASKVSRCTRSSSSSSAPSPSRSPRRSITVVSGGSCTGSPRRGTGGAAARSRGCARRPEGTVGR